MIDNRLKAPRKAKQIWYAWYPGDYAGKTSHLTLLEHGAYRVLLDHYYQMGGRVVANATILLRVCRAFDSAEVAAVHSVLAEFFTVRDGHYHHERADAELQKREELREKRAASGSLGGKQKVANATILLDGCYTQSQSQSHIALVARQEEKVNEHPKAEPIADKAPPQSKPSDREVLNNRLVEALGIDHKTLFRRVGFQTFPATYQDWLAAGCDPEKDIWPTITKLVAKANAKGQTIASSRYFEIAVLEARDLRLASLPSEAEQRERIDGAVFAFKKENWWHDDYGPKPGEPGCRVPADILQKHFGPEPIAAMH